MSFLKNGNWGLKLIALTLAIVIYYLIKSESPKDVSQNDRQFFNYPS